MELKRLLRNQWDRTLAGVLAVGGLVAIYLGYRGVADAVVPAQQIPYLASGGIIGLFLLGAAATIWLSSDLRDEWRRIDDLVDEVRSLTAERDDLPRLTSASNGRSDGQAATPDRTRPLAAGTRDVSDS